MINVILTYMKSLIVLGRQPALGLAELESLYGAEKLRPIGKHAVEIDLEPEKIDFDRLGGMVKFCKVLTKLDTTGWDDIQHFLEKTVPQHLEFLPEGKLRLGLSVYDINVSVKRLQATGLQLKKIIRSAGRSVRYIPNVELVLNSAQVLHNQLTSKLGWELVFIRDAGKTIVAQSIAVQDIEAYRRRDQKRPFRDPRVGMLPPKLAQIIINLATGSRKQMTILDPFCGTGVILQEALLMNYAVAGTDINLRMIEYSINNLRWLHERFNPTARIGELIEADATSHSWSSAFGAIASETYLGPPFTDPPEIEKLQKIVYDSISINRRFLQNVSMQTKPGFRMCLAVPAWKTNKGFTRLPILDHLEKLGYNRLSFVHAGEDDLIYHRPDQIVARELVVLIRK